MYKPTVLIFDSGVGGLSVYDKIKQLLPNINYIYVFDNDAFPYGEKKDQFVIERVLHIINKVQQKHSLSIVIIACNTASTISLSLLRNRFQIPIVGVVPAIKLASRLTCNGVIGLLATKATVNRKYTKDLIKKFAFDLKVEIIASSELVKLAEKKIYSKVISIEALLYIVEPWLKMKEPPDTIVLGCTHFNLLKLELKEVLCNGTKFIDSSTAIARRVLWLINNHKNLILSESDNIAYCTKDNNELEKFAYILTSKGFSQLKKISI